MIKAKTEAEVKVEVEDSPQMTQMTQMTQIFNDQLSIEDKAKVEVEVRIC